ncbi:MAG: hypothetical protein ACI4OJ_04665 [Lachnospiraceae bacterium]
MMRGVLRTGVVLLSVLLPGLTACACAKTDRKAPAAYDAEETAKTADTEELVRETDPGRVVLVWTDEKLPKKELHDILTRYSLSVVYDYENFNAYALSSQTDLSEEEMDKLLQDLSQEPHVLEALRDEVYTLDGAEPSLDIEEAE